MSHALLVDVAHDLVELSIDFFVGPVEVHSVLGHFETRGSYTTSVDCLTRSEEHLLFYEVLSSFGRTTHVRRFSYDGYAVSVEHLSIFFVHFVLRSARHSDVYLLLPRLLASEELSVGELLSVVRDDVVTAGAEVEQRLELLGGVDTVWVVDVAVRTRDGDDLSTELRSLLSYTPSYVTEARDSYRLALEVDVVLLADVLYEVDSAEARRFGTQARATEGEALTGHRTRVLVSKALVLTVHIGDFATTYADVPCGYVGVRADVAPQLAHEALAESHDFAVALTLRREVGTALTTAHRQRGECILEGLFEAEELQDREVDRGMEADTTLVWADSVVELYAVADVHMDFTCIVDPRYTEGDDTVGLYEAFHNSCLFELGVLVVDFFYREKNFLHSLEEFLFPRVLCLERGQNLSGFHN